MFYPRAPDTPPSDLDGNDEDFGGPKTHEYDDEDEEVDRIIEQIEQDERCGHTDVFPDKRHHVTHQLFYEGSKFENEISEERLKQLSLENNYHSEEDRTRTEKVPSLGSSGTVALPMHPAGSLPTLLQVLLTCRQRANFDPFFIFTDFAKETLSRYSLPLGMLYLHQLTCKENATTGTLLDNYDSAVSKSHATSFDISEEGSEYGSILSKADDKDSTLSHPYDKHHVIGEHAQHGGNRARRIARRSLAESRSRRLSEGRASVSEKLDYIDSKNELTSFATVNPDIDKQLEFNKTSERGPGKAQCVAANSRYLVLGTTKGIVMTAFHTGRVQNFLCPKGASSAGQPTDGAVTTVDVCSSRLGSSFGEQLQLCLAGYQSGRLILWNIEKGYQIKLIEPDTQGRERIAIQYVKFYHEVASSETVGYVRIKDTNDDSSSQLSDSEKCPKAVILDAVGKIWILKLDFNSFLRRWSYEISPGIPSQNKIGYLVSAAVLPPTYPLRLAHKGMVHRQKMSRTGSEVDFSDPSKQELMYVEAEDAGSLPVPATDLACLSEYGGLVAVSTFRATYLMVTEPNPTVVYCWRCPEGVSTDSMPALAWGRAKVKGNKLDDEHRAICSTVPIPTLARGWGNQVELLQVHPRGGFQVDSVGLEKDKNESVTSNGSNKDAPITERTSFASSHSIRGNVEHPHCGPLAFVETDCISTTDPMVALSWLDSHHLAILLQNNLIIVFDTITYRDLDEIETESMKLVNQRLGMPSAWSGSPPESVSNSWYPNKDGILHILGDCTLKSLRICAWYERVNMMFEKANSLEALNLARKHYQRVKRHGENAAARYERRARQRSVKSRGISSEKAVGGLTKVDHQRVNKLRQVPSHVTEKVREYLDHYVQMELNSPPPAKDDDLFYTSAEILLYKQQNYHPRISQYTDVNTARPARSSRALMHWRAFASVAIEYCVSVDAQDVLFSKVFPVFERNGFGPLAIFLETLEPFILSDRLTNITPQCMKMWAVYCRATGKLTATERCLLHLPFKHGSADLNSSVRLCLEHGLFSALLYIFNEGLSDFKTPVDILLCAMFSSMNSTSLEVGTDVDPTDVLSKLFMKHPLISLNSTGSITQFFTEDSTLVSEQELEQVTRNPQISSVVSLTQYISQALLGWRFPWMETDLEGVVISTSFCFHPGVLADTLVREAGTEIDARGKKAELHGFNIFSGLIERVFGRSTNLKKGRKETAPSFNTFTEPLRTQMMSHLFEEKPASFPDLGEPLGSEISSGNQKRKAQLERWNWEPVVGYECLTNFWGPYPRIQALAYASCKSLAEILDIVVFTSLEWNRFTGYPWWSAAKTAEQITKLPFYSSSSSVAETETVDVNFYGEGTGPAKPFFQALKSIASVSPRLSQILVLHPLSIPAAVSWKMLFSLQGEKNVAQEELTWRRLRGILQDEHLVFVYSYLPQHACSNRVSRIKSMSEIDFSENIEENVPRGSSTVLSLNGLMSLIDTSILQYTVSPAERSQSEKHLSSSDKRSNSSVPDRLFSPLKLAPLYLTLGRVIASQHRPVQQPPTFRRYHLAKEALEAEQRLAHSSSLSFEDRICCLRQCFSAPSTSIQWVRYYDHLKNAIPGPYIRPSGRLVQHICEGLALRAKDEKLEQLKELKLRRQGTVSLNENLLMDGLDSSFEFLLCSIVCRVQWTPPLVDRILNAFYNCSCILPCLYLHRIKGDISETISAYLRIWKGAYSCSKILERDFSNSETTAKHVFHFIRDEVLTAQSEQVCSFFDILLQSEERRTLSKREDSVRHQSVHSDDDFDEEVASSFQGDSIPEPSSLPTDKASGTAVFDDENTQFGEIGGKQQNDGELAGRRRIERMRHEVMRRLYDLIQLDADATTRLILELFPKESSRVISALEAFPHLQFRYLHQLIASSKSTVSALLRQYQYLTESQDSKQQRNSFNEIRALGGDVSPLPLPPYHVDLATMANLEYTTPNSILSTSASKEPAHFSPFYEEPMKFPQLPKPTEALFRLAKENDVVKSLKEVAMDAYPTTVLNQLMGAPQRNISLGNLGLMTLEELVAHSGIELSADMHLLYIRHLCARAPRAVVLYLQSQPDLPVDSVLKIVKDEFANTSATASILDKGGKPGAALKKCCTALDEALRDLEREFSVASKEKTLTTADVTTAVNNAHSLWNTGEIPPLNECKKAVSTFKYAHAEYRQSLLGLQKRHMGLLLPDAPLLTGNRKGRSTEGGASWVIPVLPTDNSFENLKLHPEEAIEIITWTLLKSRWNKVEELEYLLWFTIELCSRNTDSSSMQEQSFAEGTAFRDDSAQKRFQEIPDVAHSSQLWFFLLDKVVKHQKDLRSRKQQLHDPKKPLYNHLNAEDRGCLDTALTASIVLASRMMMRVLEAMRRVVPLHIVLKKITEDHPNSAFGAFRDTILGMLDTNFYEQRILETSTQLVKQDLYTRIRDLHCQSSRGIIGRVPRNSTVRNNSRGSCLVFGSGHVADVNDHGHILEASRTKLGQKEDGTNASEDEQVRKMFEESVDNPSALLGPRRTRICLQHYLASGQMVPREELAATLTEEETATQSSANTGFRLGYDYEDLLERCNKSKVDETHSLSLRPSLFSNYNNNPAL